MRILALLHGYPPYHNAGAETMAHQIHRWLVRRGHTVTVEVRRTVALTLDGVTVRQRGPARWVDRNLARHDLAITHLDETPIATEAARRVGVPLVHLLHNDRQIGHHRLKPSDVAALVANSHWIADTIPEAFAAVPRVVVWPPTDPADYDTEPAARDALTLVNPLDLKGAPLVYRLAERLPDRRFLIVTGGYGAQIPPPPLPNITVRPNRPDMGPVWRQTRLLLAPSAYESFGKAAAEAHAAAIPVLAHPTPGLLENLGAAGHYIDRDDDDAWAATIAAFDDPETYAVAAKAARARAEEAAETSARQLRQLEALLVELVAR